MLELRLSFPPPQLLAVVALGVSATTSTGGGGRSRPFRSRKTLSASEEASEEASSLPARAAAALLSCELSRLEDRGLLDLWYDAWLGSESFGYHTLIHLQRYKVNHLVGNRRLT